MSTVKEDEAFASEMKDCVEISVNNSALENAISWIGRNMDVEEVFDEKKILEAASNYDPSDVFKNSELELWAESNGYTKE